MKHIPVTSINVKDKIRIRAKGHADIFPVMHALYIEKIDLAPDGAKVLWVTHTPPANSTPQV